MLEITFPLFELLFMFILPLVIIIQLFSLMIWVFMEVLVKKRAYESELAYPTIRPVTKKKKEPKKPLSRTQKSILIFGDAIRIMLDISLIIAIVWPLTYLFRFWMGEDLTTGQIWYELMVNGIGLPTYVILLRGITRLIFINMRDQID